MLKGHQFTLESVAVLAVLAGVLANEKGLEVRRAQTFHLTQQRPPDIQHQTLRQLGCSSLCNPVGPGPASKMAQALRGKHWAGQSLDAC